MALTPNIVNLLHRHHCLDMPLDADEEVMVRDSLDRALMSNTGRGRNPVEMTPERQATLDTIRDAYKDMRQAREIVGRKGSSYIDSERTLIGALRAARELEVPWRWIGDACGRAGPTMFNWAAKRGVS